MFITESNWQHHCNEARKRQTSQKPELFLEINFLLLLVLKNFKKLL